MIINRISIEFYFHAISTLKLMYLNINKNQWTVVFAYLEFDNSIFNKALWSVFTFSQVEHSITCQILKICSCVTLFYKVVWDFDYLRRWRYLWIMTKFLLYRKNFLCDVFNDLEMWLIRIFAVYEFVKFHTITRTRVYAAVWSVLPQRATEWNFHYLIFAKMILNSPSRVSYYITCLTLSDRCKLIDYDTLHLDKKTWSQRNQFHMCVKKVLAIEINNFVLVSRDLYTFVLCFHFY